MERKRSCEIVTHLEKYVLKGSSSETVAAMEGNVFWKSTLSKKSSFREKVFAEYYFSKKLAFSKM